MKLNIAPLDLAIILVYLVGILIVGIVSTKRQSMSSENYFLAGRGLGWITIGAALFASLRGRGSRSCCTLVEVIPGALLLL